MDDYLLVSAGLNIQKFERNSNFNLNEHPELLDGLDILPNGEICGVKRELIKNVLDDYSVSSIRNGLKRPKPMDIEGPDDFLKIIAVYIDLEEYWYKLSNNFKSLIT